MVQHTQKQTMKSLPLQFLYKKEKKEKKRENEVKTTQDDEKEKSCVIGYENVDLYMMMKMQKK